MTVTFSRRELGRAAGALVLAFSFAPRSTLAQTKLPGSLDKNRMLDGWLRINADGTATILAGKVECGQGILTRLPRSRPKSLTCRSRASR